MGPQLLFVITPDHTNYFSGIGKVRRIHGGIGKLDGRPPGWVNLDGLAQPMGELDGLASKKPRRRPRSGLLRGRVSGRVSRPAGGLPVWGAAGPHKNVNPQGSK